MANLKQLHRRQISYSLKYKLILVTYHDDKTFQIDTNTYAIHEVGIKKVAKSIKKIPKGDSKDYSNIPLLMDEFI